MKAPSDWKIRTLDEVAEIQTGLSKSGSRVGDFVRLPYLRVANVQDGRFDLSDIKEIEVPKDAVDRYRVVPGDLLLTEGGDFDKLGRGALWAGAIKECVHQNHIFVVRANSRILDRRFLALQTQGTHGRTYFQSCSKQSTNLASINSTQLKQFPVLLPPLQEQRKIADILGTWDDALQKFDTLFTAKERCYLAVLEYVLKQHSNKVCKVCDVAYETGPRNRAKKVTRVLSVTNAHGFILPENYFDRQVASSDTTSYKIVRRGEYAYNPSRINVGSIARLEAWNEGIVSPIYVVFALNGGVEHDYFHHWLNSHEARSRIRRNGQGSVRDSVNFDDFSSIRLPLPDRAQQKTVADCLNTAQAELRLLRDQRTALDQQKRGLMQQLLTGEVRVSKQ